nr:glutathione S-transferase C-terminal domain-containing protein [Sphingomonas sp. Y57]
MIDLYSYDTPNVQKISIVLQEVGLSYCLKPIDIFAGEQFQPEYLVINPNNKLPAIVDHEGPGGKPHVVFESGAILIYLAEKTGKLLPAEPAARSRTLQWLMVQMSGVGPSFGQLGYYQSRAEVKAPEAVERFEGEVRRLYGVLDRRLATNVFLAGDEYSIADIAVFPWTTERVRTIQAFDWSGFANVRRWHENLASREAVRRGLASLCPEPAK